VNFLSSGSVLVPQAGTSPLQHGDFEDSDKTQVFAAAAQLNTLAGNFRSELLGNTALLQLDATLTIRPLESNTFPRTTRDLRTWREPRAPTRPASCSSPSN
jgi:hypothetical protein